MPCPGKDSQDFEPHSLTDAPATPIPDACVYFTQAKAVSLQELEQNYVLHVVARTRTLDEAAKLLGIMPATLWRMRRRYGAPVGKPRGLRRGMARDVGPIGKPA